MMTLLSSMGPTLRPREQGKKPASKIGGESREVGFKQWGPIRASHQDTPRIRVRREFLINYSVTLRSAEESG